MRPRTMVAINLIGVVAFVSVFYWFGGDHSPLMLLRWALLFITTLLFPMYLSGKAEAELSRLPQPAPRELTRMAVYPVWVGIMALGAAMALLQRMR